MEYKKTLKLNKDYVEYLRNLLSIEDLSIDNKGIGRIDDYIGIASVDFPNNKSITIDLASGSTNYYDNVVLWEKDGIYYNELDCSDCNFDIGTFELFHDDDIYIVEIEEV